jgi:DNA primase
LRDEDIALVREKSPIAEVVGQYVALANAGGGNLKGICPFHDEKSASLNVSPTKGLFYCFGCSAGGDVIGFIEQIERLTFADAVEQLAQRAGVTLTYVDGPSTGRRTGGQRARLVEANAAAAAFYALALRTAEAAPAREFLAARGFDEAAATTFGCGYAPSGWEALTGHLLAKGFTIAELEAAGLSRRSSRGTMVDRFHRRLLWPIRDISGDVVGFGARRLYDDDPIEAKYLNTPETALYKKSQLLYGADLAKKDIARAHQAVVVEGYTDVMACHLAGVTTAVATCGTAFGSDHVGVLRRLLMDSDTFRGAVIFTFDGDAAGMRAAERAFADDQKFMTQTFVAIEATGMDPCDLRLAKGDAAVRDLVGARIALVEFVLRATVARYDLETAEGRVAALDQGVPMVARIKDLSLRDEYARRLAGLVGLEDPNSVVARVRGLVRSTERGGAGRDGSNGQNSNGRNGNGASANGAYPGGHGRGGQGPGGAASNGARSYGPGASASGSNVSGPSGPSWNGQGPGGGGPNGDGTNGSASGVRGGAAAAAGPRSPVIDETAANVEREALKLALQEPGKSGPFFDAMLPPTAFHVPELRQVREAVASAGGVSAGLSGAAWIEAIGQHLPDDRSRALARSLAMERLHAPGDQVPDHYPDAVFARLQEIVLSRNVAIVKARLQRLNPQENPDEHTRLFGELLSLEKQRRDLRDRGIGWL